MGFGLKGECGKPSQNSDPSVRGLLYRMGAAWMRGVAFEIWIDVEHGLDESGVSSLMELDRAVGSSGGCLIWDGYTLTRPPSLRAEPRWASPWSESNNASRCRGSQLAEPGFPSITDPPLSIERGSPWVGTK